MAQKDNTFFFACCEAATIVCCLVAPTTAQSVSRTLRSAAIMDRLFRCSQHQLITHHVLSHSFQLHRYAAAAVRTVCPRNDHMTFTFTSTVRLGPSIQATNPAPRTTCSKQVKTSQQFSRLQYTTYRHQYNNHHPYETFKRLRNNEVAPEHHLRRPLLRGPIRRRWSTKPSRTVTGSFQRTCDHLGKDTHPTRKAKLENENQHVSPSSLRFNDMGDLATVHHS